MIHIHLLTKKRFDAKQRVRGDVAFARLLIGKRYSKGPNFDSFQVAQNANFPIGDVVNTKLTNFGTIENVGHIDGNNIRGVKDTIPLKTIEIIDQSLAIRPPIHYHCACPRKFSNIKWWIVWSTTPTNDGDASLSRIIPIDIWTFEFNFDIALLKHIFRTNIKG